MQVITSYKTKIIGYNHIFDETLAIYREALAYIIEIVDAEWDSIEQINKQQEKQRFVERLIHGTSKRVAKYDFDQKFYKYPSYLLRSTISDAIGKVQSYCANLKNWENGKNGDPPRLQLNHYEFPTFYKGNMYDRMGHYSARVKIFHKGDWVWLTIALRKSDVDYIDRYKGHIGESAPTIVRSGKRWYLRFAFEEKCPLTERKEIITAVDLGINNAATCSAMLHDGTIIGRKIISFPIEQDQIGHKLNKIKKAQQDGAKSTPRLWAFANNINRALSEKTAKAIIEFATSYGSDVIVFEHLDTKGKKRGSKKQKLHMWKKQAVIAMATTKAHLLGIRISTVCAWGTSKLAFDGSGRVERGTYIQNGEEKHNYSICVFPTGKQYHCDLNASYNIGARYFIRERLKSLPETERLEAVAKVPRLTKRTTCVLSDLISLDAELAALAA